MNYSQFELDMTEYENNRKKYKNIYPREGAEKFQVVIKGSYVGFRSSLCEAVKLRDMTILEMKFNLIKMPKKQNEKKSLTETEKKILDFIDSKNGGYASAREIERVSSYVSIRQHIASINKFLLGKGFKLENKRAVGYRLVSV